MELLSVSLCVLNMAGVCVDVFFCFVFNAHGLLQPWGPLSSCTSLLQWGHDQPDPGEREGVLVVVHVAKTPSMFGVRSDTYYSMFVCLLFTFDFLHRRRYGESCTESINTSTVLTQAVDPFNARVVLIPASATSSSQWSACCCTFNGVFAVLRHGFSNIAL